MATALTSQYTRFTDKCNRVLAGGVVKTFEPYSLTPKITYQDPAATIPNLPEVTLDATGRAKIYLLGEYRIQVYSCDGVLIEDNLFVEQLVVQSDLDVLLEDVQEQIDASVAIEEARATAAEQDLQDQISTLGGGTYGFATYAAFDAVKSTIPANSIVHIDEVNTGSGTWGQGLNTWDGTTLKKSPYDPLQQSKDYTNTSLPIVLRENMYNPANNTADRYIQESTGTIFTQAGNAITFFPVEEGKTYALYAADVRTPYLAVSLSTNNGTSSGKQQTPVVLTATSNPNIKTFTVPTGLNLKYAFVNVLWPNFNFDIRNSIVIQKGETIEYVVKQVRGVMVYDTASHKRLDDYDAARVVVKADVVPADTGPSIAKTEYTNLNVQPGTGLIRAATGTNIARFDIVAGKRYKLKAPDLRAAYVIVSVSPTNDVYGGKPQTLVNLTEIDTTTKIFTAPENMISACINTLWPNFSLDIRTTLVIEELEPYEVTQILGAPIADEPVRARVTALEEGGAGTGYVSVLKNKKWAVIGDSITATNNGWATLRYFDYIASAVGGMILYNFGISSTGYGDRWATMASQITDAGYDPDYITVFMGTNDFRAIARPLGVFGDTTNATIAGAIYQSYTRLIDAFPTKKIGVITPLPRGGSVGPNWGENAAPNEYGCTLKDIVDMIIKHCNHFSIPYMDLYREGGLFSYDPDASAALVPDGIHPNNAGHTLLGQKWLKFMESL